MDAATAAILLAAGESRRMEHPKPLLPWLGTTLIAYQAEQLVLAGCRPIVVVLGAEARRIAVPLRHLPELILVCNPVYTQGKSTSLLAGLKALPAGIDALLLAAVDQPRRAQTLRRLLDVHQEGTALITVPVYQGRRGHPPVVSFPLLPAMERFSEEGLGLRDVMQRYRSETREVPMEGPEVMIDLNTPEEYQQALDYFQRL